jgi:hypothetical protein
MQMRRHPGHAARKDLATLGDKFFEEIGIFVIDRFQGNVDPAARHGAIRATKSGTAFGCLGLHDGLFGFAMQGMLAQKRIVFLLFEAVWGLRTLLIPGAHVTRDRFAESLGFSAFERDDFLGHKLFFRFLGRRFFFFGLATFLVR